MTRRRLVLLVNLAHVCLCYLVSISEAHYVLRSAVPSTRPSTSTSTSSSNTPLAQSHPRRPPQTAAERLEEELERTLLGEDEDAIGESDDEIAALLPPEPVRRHSPVRQDPTPPKKAKALSFKKNVPRPGSIVGAKPKAIMSKEEEEESEGEIIEPPKVKAPSPVVAPPTKPPAKSKPTKKSIAEHAAAIRANAKTQQPTVSSGPHAAPAPPVHPLPPKPPSATVTPSAHQSTKASSSKKRELPTDTLAVLPPSKKVKPLPPPRPAPPQRLPGSKPAPKLKETPKKEKEEGFSLALPGSEGVSLPTALELLGPSQPSIPEPALPGDDSDSEEWDPVVEVSPPAPAPVEQPSRRLVMEEIIPEPTAHPMIPNPALAEEDEDEEDYEAVDIDEDIFGQELEAIVPDDEDDEAMEPVEPIEPHFSGPPLRIGEIVGNAFGEGNDTGEGDDTDEYSSSDDSD